TPATRRRRSRPGAACDRTRRSAAPQRTEQRPFQSEATGLDGRSAECRLPGVAHCPKTGLARSDAPVSAADPIDDEAAVFVRCLLPGEVAGVEWMDLAVGEEVVEVLVVRPRHEVVVSPGDDLC